MDRMTVVIDVDSKRGEAAVDSLNKTVLGLGTATARSTGQASGSFDRMTQSMTRAATRARTTVSGISSSITDLGKRIGVSWSNAVNNIGADTFARNMKNLIQNPMQVAGEAAETLLLRMGPLGVAMVGVGLMAAGAAVGVFKLVSSFGDAAEKISNLAASTGLSTTEVQEFSLAADSMGSSFGALEAAMRPLTQALSENSAEGKKAKQALHDMGVSAVDDLERFIGVLPFLERFGKRLSELPAGPIRSEAAFKVMGRGAKDLIPTLMGLSEALKMVRDSGAVMSEGLVQSGVKVDSYFDRLKIHLVALRNMVSAPFVITIETIGSITENAAGGALAGARSRLGGPDDVFGKKKSARESFVGPIDESDKDKAIRRANQDLVEYNKNLTGQEILEERIAAAKIKREEDFGRLQATLGNGPDAFKKAKQVFEQSLAAERALKAQSEAMREAVTDGKKAQSDALAARKKAAEEIQQVEEGARRVREAAMLSELEGLNKIDEKYRQLRAEDARKVGVDGSPKAFNDLESAQRTETEDFNKDLAKKAYAGLGAIQKDSEKARKTRTSDALGEAAEIQEQTALMERQRLDDASAYSIQAIDTEKQARLAALEEMQQTTVAQQIDVSQRRAAIEEEYATKRALAEIARIDEETRRRVEMERTVLQAKVAAGAISQHQADANLDAMQQLSVEKARQISVDLETDKAAIQQSARVRELTAVRAHYKSMFDDFKRSFEGVFDQLVTGTLNLGTLMKTVLLSALKSVLASQFATMFARLVTGQSGGSMGGASGGGSSAGGGIMGQVFGGLGMAGSFGGGNPAGMLGPGGTAPFAGGGGAGGGSSFGGLLSGQAAGVKGFLTKLGGLGRGGTDVLGNKLGSVPGTAGANATGVGGVAGGAMLAGGGLLAMDGLRRGGLLGLAETTAGGALIGAKFGGPMGALIGGAIGAVAGSIRLLFKSATEKAKRKVKEVYGIDIDAERSKQIAAIAKESFGGNLDMAVRSPQVRDLIQLYGEATGQNGGLRSGARGATLVQTAGGLYQGASYENGKAIGLQSSLPSLGSFVVAPGAGASNGSVSLTLNYDATVDVLSGHAVQAVKNNPEVVSDSLSIATRSNYGRRETTAAQLSPSTLTR